MLVQHEAAPKPPQVQLDAKKKKLGEQPECAADVARLCSKLSTTNNFAVIDCLQSDNVASIVELFRTILWPGLPAYYRPGSDKCSAVSFCECCYCHGCQPYNHIDSSRVQCL